MPEVASGPLQLDLLDGLTTGPSGPAPAPASRSRRQAKAEVSTIHGICGPTSFGSSVPAGPLSSWESRLRERLATVGSTECALIWREKTTPAGASISRLAPWTPPTSASGSTGSPWPTPTLADVQGGRKTRSGARSGELLMNGLLASWSTPRASDGEKGGPNMSFGAGGQPLPAQMHKASPWVTPSARDWKDTPGMATVAEDGRVRLDQLPRQMAAASTWPTPTSRDHFPPHTPEYIAKHKANGHGMSNLNDTLALAAPSGPTPNGSPATTAKRGAPNPVFAFWLMGWPDEFQRGVLRAIQSLPRSRRRS